MITIMNGFDFKDPCKTDVRYKVWTKEPDYLGGKCVATDIIRERSIGLYVLADRKKGLLTRCYHLKKDLGNYNLINEQAKLINDMIGFTALTGERPNIEEKPLGCILNPESYTVAKALYNLTANLTMIEITSKKPITDILVRDIIFSPDQFTKNELAELKEAGHIPPEHGVLQLTADLYRR